MSLDDAIHGARQQPLAWTHQRSARVRAGVHQRSHARAARERRVWRGLMATSVAGIVLALGRLTTHVPDVVVEAPHAAQPVAAIATTGVGDGGYERD